eukprot:g31381.t3
MKLRLSLKGGAGAPPTRGAEPTPLAPVLGPVLSPERAGLRTWGVGGVGGGGVGQAESPRFWQRTEVGDHGSPRAIQRQRGRGVVRPKTAKTSLPTGAAPKAAARQPIPGVDLALLPSVDAAPQVNTTGMSVVAKWAYNTADKRILTNPTIEALSKPLQGPIPEGKVSLEETFNNHKMGRVEKAAMSKFAFDEQYLTFHNFGYAANPCKNIPEGEEVLSAAVSTVSEEEACDVQLLQVSQSLEESRLSSLTWKGFFEAQQVNFLNAMGEAESDAILAPAATAAAAVRELRAAEAARGGLPPLPAESLAQTKVSSQTSEVTATTICVIIGAVLLAVVVCLIFSCFKPSTSYEDYNKLDSQGAASSSLDRAMRKDCC